MIVKSSLEICKSYEDKTENLLQLDVLDRLQENLSNDDIGLGPIESILADLQVMGCAGGLVRHLVYQHDVQEYLHRHKTSINDRLAELTESTGLSLREIFKSRDRSDPMMIGLNSTLVAWTSFEYAANDISDLIFGE